MQRKVLGKGLNALFTPTGDSSEEYSNFSEKKIISLPISEIIPSRNQPREKFTGEAMEELKTSIAENGILEPPIVRRKEDVYELIAGERRFRAARELGYETIDVILMAVESDEKAMVYSLIENIQREDLNGIEEAKAYRQIIASMDITQDKLSEIVGKSRSTVANTLRLLTLSSKVQDLIVSGKLVPGSARALVTVQNENLQQKLAAKIAAEGLSARKAEELVKNALLATSGNSKSKRPESAIHPFLREIKEDLQRIYGTSVKIRGDQEKGSIEINYFSRDDLERIIEAMKNDSL